ncbi:SUR7-domain-containing protein [Nadsonia fulvescens var. elongata DSM 6958]|uniref:SUR7-domain-containing protein n=1 Tax=Nadsonia fulvescens var. elongata DSM 6958 TaxID=857566 RepID=A0A1E3PL66_9ASCO|nr:SUR7-domain-containing protein [Nadsonia fulvescens var. elongata DSM 6958]
MNAILSIILGVLRFVFVSSSLFLSAGAVLLLFFIVLAGARHSSPLNRFFWIQVDTSAIASASTGGVTRWTPYGICGVSNSRNFDCTSNSAAYPFDPVRNFGSAEGLPSSFVNSSSFYYYTSRFAYAFILIALFFMVLSLLAGIVALFSRRSALVANVFNFTSWIFTVIFASLMTAALARGKRAFNGNGNSASIGVKMMSFMWTVVALQTMILIGYLIGLLISPKGNSEKNRNHERGYGDEDGLGEGYGNDRNATGGNNDTSRNIGAYGANDRSLANADGTYSEKTTNDSTRKSYFKGFSRPGRTSNRQAYAVTPLPPSSVVVGGVAADSNKPVGTQQSTTYPSTQNKPSNVESNNANDNQHYRDSVTLADHGDTDANGNWFRSTRKDKTSDEEA